MCFGSFFPLVFFFSSVCCLWLFGWLAVVAVLRFGSSAVVAGLPAGSSLLLCPLRLPALPSLGRSLAPSGRLLALRFCFGFAVGSLLPCFLLLGCQSCGCFPPFWRCPLVLGLGCAVGSPLAFSANRPTLTADKLPAKMLCLATAKHSIQNTA